LVFGQRDAVGLVIEALLRDPAFVARGPRRLAGVTPPSSA